MHRSAALAITALLLSRLALASAGGTPLVLVHSGYLLGASDEPLTAPAVSLVFRISDQPSSAGQTIEWEGTCAGVPVTAGYYAVQLGSGACAGSTAGGLDPVLDSADLPAGAARWLEVEVGGIALSPRQVVQIAPAAASALSAGALGGVAAATLVDGTTGKLRTSALPAGADGTVLTSSGGSAIWATPPATVASFNGRTGAVALGASDVTTALGYTPAAASGAPSYVQTSPGSPQAGSFHLAGSGTLGGDLFLQGLNALDLFPFYRMTANQLLNSSGGASSVDGWSWNSGAGVTVAYQYTVSNNVPFSSRSADEQALLTAMGRAGTQYVRSAFRVYRMSWTSATTGKWTMYQQIAQLPSVTVAAFTKLESGSISGWWAEGATSTWSLTGVHATPAAHGYDHIHPTAGAPGSLLVAMPAAVAGWVDLRRPINWGWFPYVPASTVDQ